ncbi:MAG: hypothetical protein JWO36_3426 [Myxococcales bacterium]|nr:hypothetical protein [Myxococcales bacterium]
MVKLGLFASLAVIAAALGFSTLQSQADGGACTHKEFKTEIGAKACTGKDASQKAAKDAMKAFTKAANIKSCNQCHTKLAPAYDLKADAFEQFQKAGGKMLDKPVTKK